MKIKIVIIFILCGLSAYAQQEPHYTQYMHNMNVVNPGYMINEPGLVQVGGLYRTQWVGIDGSPKTANVFANIPLTDKIELGVNFLKDEIGGNININETILNIDAAYKITLNNDLKISFGMKFGMDNLKLDFSDSNVNTDPLFQNDKKTVLNIGAGVFVFKPNYYIGLSAPNLIPSDFNVNDDVVYKNDPHLFLIGGYIFDDLIDDIKLKPSAVVKQVFGSPLTFDVSVNALYQERFELGVSYRYQDAVSAMVGFNVTPDLRLGYGYDLNTSTLNSYNNGSHEFILIYRFDVLGLSKKYSSPRFY